MIRNLTKLITTAALFTAISGSALAASSEWNFRSSNNGPGTGEVSFAGGSGDGNRAVITLANGLNVRVYAWSDTRDQSFRDGVQTATVRNNNSGLLVYNQDEPDPGDSGQFDNCNHCVDNIGDTDDGESDFLLFSFSEAVALTKIRFGYREGGVDISLAAFNTLPTFGGNVFGNGSTRWSAIVAPSRVAYKNSITNAGSTVNLNIMDGSSKLEAKYWLIGAYNRAFGVLDSLSGSDKYNDGFKLAGLTTHIEPPEEASAPPVLGLLIAFGLLVAYRRKNR